MGVEEIHRLADQAQELKDHPAFAAAVLALRRQWFAELMIEKNKDAIEALVIQMRTLEAIPQQLQVFMNDWAMVKRKQHG